MHRNRSTSKRSSSPHVVVEDSSVLPQADGSCFGKPKGPAAEVEMEDANETSQPRQLPGFLQLTDAGKHCSSDHMIALTRE